MWRVLERMAEGRAEKAEIDMLLDVSYQVEGPEQLSAGVVQRA